MLDEADRLLDPTFEAPLRSVLAALPPAGRQTLLFSATMTRALVALQAERLQGAHVFQAYSGLVTADKLRQVRVGGRRAGGTGGAQAVRPRSAKRAHGAAAAGSCGPAL